MRVEQLYPTPVDEVSEVLASYPNAADIVWVQEEPANQGAWPHMELSLPEGLPEGVRLRRVSRRAVGLAGCRVARGARGGAGGADRGRVRRLMLPSWPAMYFTDRGHRGAGRAARRGTVTLEWLAERLRDFVDQNPEFETAVDRLATWLARADDELAAPDRATSPSQECVLTTTGKNAPG